ncbi:MAG: 16S rRNA (guanine(527)-N(7))-methyltransferase RsmG [Bacteroidetes bacterium]|nr:16S rRNA (guanine(527)-N(7))-methyltransferase RsmG [Bacteroidota bacterium]
MSPGVDLLTHYFPALSQTQLEQFDLLLPLYKEWNEKINVISRKDIDQLYERHVLHSLGIAKVVSFADGTKVIDAGTGGGFPGIPLAILFADVQFHLVDSIGKKIKVVDEVVSALQLKNVTTEHGRVEGRGQKFDFAVSRAVAPLDEMIYWLKPLISKGESGSLPNGMLFLKGGDLKEEITAAGKNVKIFELKDFFKEEFFAEKKVLYVRTF